MCGKMNRILDLSLMQQIFIATPHIAGYSSDGKANGTAVVVNALSKYFNFPVKNWFPENIPPPVCPYISIDCDDKDEEDDNQRSCDSYL